MRLSLGTVDFNMILICLLQIHVENKCGAPTLHVIRNQSATRAGQNTTFGI